MGADGIRKLLKIWQYLFAAKNFAVHFVSFDIFRTGTVSARELRMSTK